MSVPQPSSVTLTIQGLVNKVVAFLQNNPNATESNSNPEMRPSAWIRDSLREITANNPFTELEVVGPLVTIGPGMGWQGSNYAYPISQFLQPGTDLTLMDDPVIFLTPAQGQQVGLTPVQSSGYPTTNLVAYGMDYLSKKAIQSLLFIPGGIPFKYTRHGNQFWFGTQPGQPYNVYLPYQKRHPFSPTLLESPMYVPEDWWDIIAMAAAQRGAVANRWNDQADFLHKTLYGDPESMNPRTGKMDRPGLIAAKLYQPERDRAHSPVQINCGVARY